MSDRTVAVTRFRADNVHLEQEPLPSMEPLVRRPRSSTARQYQGQIRPNADVLPTHGVCNRVNQLLCDGIGVANGWMADLNNTINSSRDFVNSQINAVRDYANELARGGMLNCPIPPLTDPMSVIGNARDSILGVVRNVASMNIRLEDLILGEQFRASLVRLINGVCGLRWNDPTGMLNTAYRDLLHILENAHLFANSDLLAAISRCSMFTSQHVHHLNARTTGLCREGNVIAIRDIVIHIRETRIMSNDLSVLANTMDDSDTNAAAIVTIYEKTIRETNTLITSNNRYPNGFGNHAIPQEQQISKPFLDLGKISSFRNKPILTKAILKDNNIKTNPKLLNKLTDLIKPDKIIITKNGRTIKPATSKEQLMIKANNRKLLGAVDTKVKEFNNTQSSSNKTPDINMGLVVSTIDFSSVDIARPRISLSSSIPEKWGNVASEGYSKPSIKSFLNIDELTLLKINHPALTISEYQVEDILNSTNLDNNEIIKKPKQLLNISKDPYQINNLNIFGTKPSIKKGCMKGFQTIKQTDGNIVKVAVY